MAYRRGLDKVTVVLPRADRLWLRDRQRTTGKSMTRQLSEIVQRAVQRLRRSDRRVDEPPPGPLPPDR